MPKARSKRVKKRSFYGNRFTGDDKLSTSVMSASSSKLKLNDSTYEETIANNNVSGLTGNRIIDMQILISVFSILCCPECFSASLILVEDSRFGMCSNLTLRCQNCTFVKGFSTTAKIKRSSCINQFLVLGLRLIGRGYSAGKKLCSILSLPFLSKTSFRYQEICLLESVKECASQNMLVAAREVKTLKAVADKDVGRCGVSVDGTWQRRGYSSLNGCTSAIAIDTGKVLDVEILSQYCRACKTNNKRFICDSDSCANHHGSSGKMEVVGAFRMFERSQQLRNLLYNEYYGDGDSKGYEAVKDMYGVNTVVKLECVGHVQKRVGSNLRKLKKSNKMLGGKGKLTDTLIDKLQNYYGIAIRSNVGNLEKMQSACIAAFFHCCSGKNKQMHGQCPKGSDSWCKFQRAESEGTKLKDMSAGLPLKVINTIKSTYMKLCDQNLLKKCLHGRTQNCNESFNGVVWKILPKETFVEIQTLRLGIYIAVILFNSGYAGLLSMYKKLGVTVTTEVLKSFKSIDNSRIHDSNRQSSPSTKLLRRQRRAIKKRKIVNYELKEGITYKSGEF